MSKKTLEQRVCDLEKTVKAFKQFQEELNQYNQSNPVEEKLEEAIEKKEISPMLPEMLSDAVSAWNVAASKGDGKAMRETLELIKTLIGIMKGYSLSSDN